MPDLMKKPADLAHTLDLIEDKLQKAGMRGLFNIKNLGMIAEKLSSDFRHDEDLETLKDLIQWLDDERASNHIFAKREGLNTLAEWRYGESGHFSQIHNKFFRVVGVKVTSPYREVPTWSQPILDNEGIGIIGLLIRKHHCRTHFLMQAKADVGNRNIVQLGPTVQFNPGNYIDNDKLKKPFLFDEFLNSKGFIQLKKSVQAEEGGRFYREGNVHKILMLPDRQELSIPPEFRWVSYPQLRFFLHLGDMVNSSARSILACLI